MAATTQPLLLPAPRSCDVDPTDCFTLTADSAIAVDAELETAARWLADRLRSATGFALPVVRHPSDGAGPIVRLRRSGEQPPEGFDLWVRGEGVVIEAADSSGALYGAGALLQLFDADVFRRAPVRRGRWSALALHVRDWPEYSWRGVMLDVARHFRTVAEILRFVDLMAVHRFNTLQLHLTDDQGWRLEVPRYPRLTEVAAWRTESLVGAGPDARGDGRPHGGYYTAEDLREIVSYAAFRGIEVIPEVEAPGHVQALVAAYPELGVGDVAPDVSTRWGLHEYALNAEESTVEFFCHVLDEVVAIFDSEFVSIGGDECDTAQWAADARTVERLRELGIDSVSELQAWFVGRLGAHLGRRGKRMLAWDDVLTGPVPDDTVVLSWRGLRGAVVAAEASLDVVMAPEDRAYLDYRQSESCDEPIPVGTVTSLERSYGMSVVPPELDGSRATRVVGAQAQLWSEHLDSVRALDFAAFPRLAALSEVFWGTEQTFSEFCVRLDAHLVRLRAMGVEHRPLDGPLPWQKRPDAPGKPRKRGDREAEVERLTRDVKSL